MEEPEPRRLFIAKWSTRFWAWLIDVIVVGAVINAFWGAIGVMMIWSVNPFMVGELGEFGSLNGLGLWVYWTLLEGYRGQSIGKLMLNLEVTDREGNPIDYGAAAIESFGKAFLLRSISLSGWSPTRARNSGCSIASRTRSLSRRKQHLSKNPKASSTSCLKISSRFDVLI